MSTVCFCTDNEITGSLVYTADDHFIHFLPVFSNLIHVTLNYVTNDSIVPIWIGEKNSSPSAVTFPETVVTV